ncbi:hypothetical protein [Streptomyces virginiae]|uniref:hypothetical protein n=1 Tax=Streptomyces virginiae TaxID=1961 RepID=UPI002DBB7942|nr:hypothetical protein [Streptomyces sp. CMAA1738]MEC4575751.1 hypothetical protein [Streptomyces sp. CMAA1738]
MNSAAMKVVVPPLNIAPVKSTLPPLNFVPRKSKLHADQEVGAWGCRCVDAHLSLLDPVVGEPSHGVYASQAHRCLVVPELVGGGGEALSELLVVGPMSIALRKALLAIGVDPCEDSAGKGEGRQRGADHLVGSDGVLWGGLLRRERVKKFIDPVPHGQGQQESEQAHYPDGPQAGSVSAW